MTMTFKKIPLFKEWTLTDDSIIVGSNVIPLSLITSVKYTPNDRKSRNAVVQVYVGTKFYTLPFSYDQNEEGDKAAKYIIENYGK